MSPRRIAKALAGAGIAALAVLAITIVWVVHHRSSAELLKQAASVVPGALLHADNFHWTQMKGDAKQWELTAREASYANSRNSVSLKDASLSMLTPDGKPVSIRAPKAVLTLAGSHVTRADLSGHMELHYGEIVVMTDQMTFLPDDDRLTASGWVTVDGNGLELRGVGLEAHPRKQLFTLKSDVSTRIMPASASGRSHQS